MIERKIDPPNLGFWAPNIFYFRIMLAPFAKKISWMQAKVESVEEKK